MMIEPVRIVFVCVSGQIADSPEEVAAARDKEEEMKASVTGVFSRELSVFESGEAGARRLHELGIDTGADEVMFLPVGNPESCARALAGGWRGLQL